MTPWERRIYLKMLKEQREREIEAQNESEGNTSLMRRAVEGESHGNDGPPALRESPERLARYIAKQNYTRNEESKSQGSTKKRNFMPGVVGSKSESSS